MRLIIAGSRSLDWVGYEFVANAVFQKNLYKDITEIVSGTAIGVDKLGERFADMANLKVKRFPANWEAHGKSAGFIRNRQMAEYADALLLIWDGYSRGSNNMLNTMKDLKKPTFQIIVRDLYA